EPVRRHDPVQGAAQLDRLDGAGRAPAGDHCLHGRGAGRQVMRNYLYVALLAFAACKSSDASKSAEPAKKAAADDPWAKKTVDPKAIKDPDLAMMTELAQGGPDAQYPQADAIVAVDRDEITLKADGSVVSHSKSIVKLLDAQRGKEKFADVHIPFDSKHG